MMGGPRLVLWLDTLAASMERAARAPAPDAALRAALAASRTQLAVLRGGDFNAAAGLLAALERHAGLGATAVALTDAIVGWPATEVG